MKAGIIDVGDRVKKLICFVLSALVLLPLHMTAAAEGEPGVSAEAAVVIEANSGKILYAKNEKQRMSMASTTKIMTSLLATEYNHPDMEITVTKEMVMVEGTSMGLVEGDQVTLEGLIYGMLLCSGNDAANTTAYVLGGSLEGFSEIMNARAQEIGMVDSHFVTPSGLDDENHYSTAYDMALLGAEAIKNPVFRQYCSSKTARVSFGNPPYKRILSGHNRLLSMYEYAIGIKTGFTKKSGRCLVSAAEKDGVLLVAVTLKAPDDWNDHISLLNYGFSRVTRAAVDTDFSECSLKVTGGALNQTTVMAKEQPEISVLNGEEGKIEKRVYIQPLVYAPITTETKVGYAEYWYADQLVEVLDLYAATNVEAVSERKETSSFMESLQKMLRVFFLRT